MVSEGRGPSKPATDAVVLILVLVEDGLGDRVSNLKRSSGIRLNPCFSGGWSRSVRPVLSSEGVLTPVLILVLVEDGLGGKTVLSFMKMSIRLNPFFSGGWSRS